MRIWNGNRWKKVVRFGSGDIRRIFWQTRWRDIENKWMIGTLSKRVRQMRSYWTQKGMWSDRCVETTGDGWCAAVGCTAVLWSREIIIHEARGTEAGAFLLGWVTRITNRTAPWKSPYPWTGPLKVRVRLNVKNYQNVSTKYAARLLKDARSTTQFHIFLHFGMSMRPF